MNELNKLRCSYLLNLHILQDLSGWASTPMWWFDSHLMVKCLNGIPVLLTKWDSFFVNFELRFSAYIALMFTTRTDALTCLLHNLKRVEMKYTLEVAYKQSVFVFRKIILFKERHGLIIQTAYFLILVIRINGKQFSYELDACIQTWWFLNWISYPFYLQGKIVEKISEWRTQSTSLPPRRVSLEITELPLFISIQSMKCSVIPWTY